MGMPRARYMDTARDTARGKGDTMITITHFHASRLATHPTMTFEIDPDAVRSIESPATRRWARRERRLIAEAYGHRRAITLGLRILQEQRRDIARPSPDRA